MRFVADAGPAEVVDVGCGWGELLLQVLAAAPGAHGTGIDANARSLDHGSALAEQRRLGGRVTWVSADARTAPMPSADAVVAVGASEIWGAPVEQAQPLNYAGALAALRAMLPRGGRAVYGEAIWSAPPTPEATAPLAGRSDEYVTLAEVVELAVAAGFAPVAVGEASLQEWDVFESGYAARYATWLADHPADHEDAPEVRERAARQRRAYLSGYRGVLGMAYLSLVAV